jgi:RNA polymerase sigma-70 factor (ECF subfamily)
MIDRDDREAREFRKLVVHHQRLLYAIALSGAGRDRADEIVQTTWERALARIHLLKDPGKVTPWLCRICRNVMIDAARKEVREEPWDENLGAGWEDRQWSCGEYEGLTRLALQLLPEPQRRVVSLRFYAGLSYREIALVCGVETETVKSRLFEAKKKLKTHLSSLAEGLEVSQKQLKLMEEHVMNEYEKAVLGAAVFCRLSLDIQVKVTGCVREGRELTDEILTEIGKIREGARFVQEFHKRILLPELAALLGSCDRYTESRLVKELEETDPASAAMVKENTFVFEDLVLLSRKTREVLYRRVSPERLKTAMVLAGSDVKRFLIEEFPEAERPGWYRGIGESGADMEEVLRAQGEIASALRDMNQRGEVEIVGLPPGW